MHQADRRGGAGRGFTLVEMAIIMVILGMILTTVLPLMTEGVFRGKAAKARATVRNLKQEIIGYALANGILPDIAAVENMGGSEDPWGHPVAYWSEPGVTSGTGVPICELDACPGNLRLTGIDSSGGSNNYNDIAFIIASRGPNANLQVGWTAGSPNGVTTYPASYPDANFNDFDHTTTLGNTGDGDPYDVNPAREEAYDDIVEYVTWGYLYDRLACEKGENLAPINSAINFDNIAEVLTSTPGGSYRGTTSAVRIDAFDNKMTMGNDVQNTRACVWYNGENATRGCNATSPVPGISICGNATGFTSWTTLRQVFKFQVQNPDNSLNSFDYGGGFVYSIIHANATASNDANINSSTAPCGGTLDGYIGYGGGGIWGPKFGVEVDFFPNRLDTVSNANQDVNDDPASSNHVATVFWVTTDPNGNVNDNDHEYEYSGVNSQVHNPQVGEDGCASNATVTWLEDGQAHWIRIVLERELTATGPGSRYTYTMHVWLDDTPSANFLDVGADNIPDAPVYEAREAYLTQAHHDMMNLFRMGWTFGFYPNGLISDPVPSANTFAISGYGFNLN
jgi:type II secretory pathway pseudopilin PulG